MAALAGLERGGEGGGGGRDLASLAGREQALEVLVEGLVHAGEDLELIAVDRRAPGAAD